MQHAGPNRPTFIREACCCGYVTKKEQSNQTKNELKIELGRHSILLKQAWRLQS